MIQTAAHTATVRPRYDPTACSDSFFFSIFPIFGPATLRNRPVPAVRCRTSRFPVPVPGDTEPGVPRDCPLPLSPHLCPPILPVVPCPSLADGKEPERLPGLAPARNGWGSAGKEPWLRWECHRIRISSRQHRYRQGTNPPQRSRALVRLIFSGRAWLNPLEPKLCILCLA